MTPQTQKAPLPRALPEPVLALCHRLEERDISAWSQGEALLEDLRPVPGSVRRTPTEPHSARVLLCTATATELLAILPRAVVTASRARRLTLATPAGPIDLLPVGHGDLEPILLNFGLSVFAFAFRPTTEHWCDPVGARAAFHDGILDITTAAADAFGPNPFGIAPRRYWISARLLSAYALEASSKLLEAARNALPQTLERLPRAAPARREVSRILAASAPERGLSFLRESGVSAALFPGMDPAGESIVAQLGPLPALRWAAWLRGSAIQRALVQFRMPLTLARQIEGLDRSHPIDRHIESLREVGVRKILGRLGDEEIDGLFRWRRLELAATAQTQETRTQSERLDEIEAQFEEARSNRQRGGQVRALALGGEAVMATLGAGPGPHVGQALAHLATFIEAHPGSNERSALERELRNWASKDRGESR